MKKDVEVTNFYLDCNLDEGELITDKMEEVEKKIQKLLDEGFVPSMQLVCDDRYSIYAFIRASKLKELGVNE